MEQTNGFEVEQKYAVNDEQQLTEILADLGVEWIDSVVQRDVYFNHPSRDFAVTDEAVRIRVEDDNACLTYKGPKLGTQAKTRKEIELPIVGGIQSESAMHGFLLELGFSEVAVVSKQRRNGTCQWQGSAVAIALDHVEQLGCFIELELLVKDASEISAAQATLDDLASRAELATSDRRGYLDMLLESDS